MNNSIEQLSEAPPETIAHDKLLQVKRLARMDLILSSTIHYANTLDYHEDKPVSSDWIKAVTWTRDMIRLGIFHSLIDLAETGSPTIEPAWKQVTEVRAFENGEIEGLTIEDPDREKKDVIAFIQNELARNFEQNYTRKNNRPPETEIWGETN